MHGKLTILTQEFMLPDGLKQPFKINNFLANVIETFSKGKIND